MPFWAPLALTATATALIALPVTPALYELRKRSDAAPLPTSEHDGKITNFAEVFQSRLEPLQPQLDLCRDKHSVCRSRIEGRQVLLVGCADFDFDPDSLRDVSAVMFGQTVVIPAGRMLDKDIYVDGALGVGEGAVLRAGAVMGDVIMKKNSAVLRWLHAQGSIYMREGSTSRGRLSADGAIYLTGGCAFERMHALQISVTHENEAEEVFCSDVGQGEIGDDNSGISTATDAFDPSRRRLRAHGDFELRASEMLSANVIAERELRFRAGSRLHGSAKSYRNMWLEDNACVHGSVICGGTVYLGPRAFVAGPIMAEGDVMLAAGSRVGRRDVLTTISCCHAVLAPGCRVHGTVWARGGGNVEG